MVLTQKQLDAYIAEFEALDERLGYLKYEAWYEDGKDHTAEINALMPQYTVLNNILSDAEYLTEGYYLIGREGGE